jgi:hypothetical protein
VSLHRLSSPGGSRGTRTAFDQRVGSKLHTLNFCSKFNYIEFSDHYMDMKYKYGSQRMCDSMRFRKVAEYLDQSGRCAGQWPCTVTVYGPLISYYSALRLYPLHWSRFIPRHQRAHFPRLRNFEVPGYDAKELSWHLVVAYENGTSINIQSTNQVQSCLFNVTVATISFRGILRRVKCRI